MYTARRTKLQFKIILEEAPVPIAGSATISYLYYLNIYIYLYKCAVKHTNCTIDKKSGEYAPIPPNIVCAVIHYLLFLYAK